MKKKIHNKDLTLRLTGYAASAGALALLSTAAHGQAVHSGVQNEVIGTPEGLVLIDMDGDGVDDFEFRIARGTSLSSNGTSFVYSNSNYAAILNPRTDANNSWASKTGTYNVYINTYSSQTSYAASVYAPADLAPGVSVNNSIAYWANITDVSFEGALDFNYTFSYYVSSVSGLVYASVGDFQGETNFLGVRFYIGDNQHYGWIRVALDDTGDNLTIVDWAYETVAETGILTGEGGDTGAPMLTISGVGTFSYESSVTLTVNADEDLEGLDAADITVVNGSVTGVTAVSASEYDVDINCTTFGNVSVEIAAGDVSDLSGNPTEDAASINWMYANTALDLTNGEGISIYPNPVENELHIDLAAQADIKLIDMNGRVVYQQEEVTKHVINVSDFSPGVYLVQLQDDEGVTHKRVVIE